MKRFVYLLAITLYALLLAACQATPDNPVVIGKGDGQLEKKILSQDNAGVPADIPQNDASVQEKLSNPNGTVDLNVDARVVRRDGMSFPAVIVKPVQFTQPQADKIIEALTGDAYFYDAADDADMTKDQIDQEVLAYQEKLRKTTDEKKQERLKQIITDLLKQRQNAPDSPEQRKPANRSFSKENAGAPFLTEGIVGKFDRGGKTYTLSIQNSADGKQSTVDCFQVGGEVRDIIGRASKNQPEEAGISYDAALKQAEELLHQMGADLSLADAFVLKSSENGSFAYDFLFTREVSGLNMVYESTDHDEYTGLEEERGKNPDLYQPPWPYERIMVSMDKEGVKGFYWQGPCEVEELLKENVSMLSFEKTMDVFKQMIFIKNTAWSTMIDNTITVDGQTGSIEKAAVSVNRITLGLSRVQSGNQFYLIPVWDFYGTVDFMTGSGKSVAEIKGLEGADAASFRESLKSMLTINAIDGSIIDRGLGY